MMHDSEAYLAFPPLSIGHTVIGKMVVSGDWGVRP